MQTLSYPAETVLIYKITRNKKVQSFKDCPRQPLRQGASAAAIPFCQVQQDLSLPLSRCPDVEWKRGAQQAGMPWRRGLSRSERARAHTHRRRGCQLQRRHTPDFWRS